MATIRKILFFPLRPFTVLAEALLARQTVASEYKGVKICHSPLHLWCNDEFTSTIEHALRLIDEKDALRFARIQRVIHYVRPLTLSGDAPAEYVRHSKLCYMDWPMVRAPDDPSLTVLSSAILLVHEATHGLLQARGVRHTVARRPLIERLCVDEEARFLRRVDPEMSRTWVEVRKPAYQTTSSNRGLVTDIREFVASLKYSQTKNREKGLTIWKH